MTTTTITGGPVRTDPVRINPSTWNLALGFDQAQVRTAPTTLLTLAGQGPVDGDGRLVHAGDLTAQVALAVRNVEELLEAAGFTVADVLSLTVHTTDVDGVLANYHLITERLAPATPPATLVGVARLALPGMAVEITVQAGR
ncbi:RidA family protein [Kineococcus sp. TBRC 1896]|uniref:RidA family protein n=1 Tax=Kineococcus mangrovi TaxID=1660183 RepID=A0ABV4I4M1_9ACTN